MSQPTTTPALACLHCGHLHRPEANGGKYIVVYGTVRGADREKAHDDQESVMVNGIVCNNHCLTGLLSLKGF